MMPTIFSFLNSASFSWFSWTCVFPFFFCVYFFLLLCSDSMFLTEMCPQHGRRGLGLLISEVRSVVNPFFFPFLRNMAGSGRFVFFSTWVDLLSHFPPRRETPLRAFFCDVLQSGKFEAGRAAPLLSLPPFGPHGRYISGGFFGLIFFFFFFFFQCSKLSGVRSLFLLLPPVQIPPFGSFGSESRYAPPSRRSFHPIPLPRFFFCE